MNIKALFATVYLLTVAGVLANVAIAAETNRSQTITRAGSQPSVKGSAEYFTGNVRVDPLFPANETASFSGAYVTFEPGARSAWHIHLKWQHLLCSLRPE
jgi:quercetin dioxygenase-like cupin family protein